MAEDTAATGQEKTIMTSVTLPFIQDFPAPFGEDASDQYPSSLVRYFINQYTEQGERIFDPFIGFGTTAFMAEDMGRAPYGVEADGERFEWAAGQLENWQNIKHGDAVDIDTYDFPKMDFCITSPPWMQMHEDWNPLYGGDPAHAGYKSYLERMTEIFSAVRSVMKRGAKIVVHVSDLDDKHGFTPLVKDMQTAVSQSLIYLENTTIEWDSDEPETHCLVFQAD